MNHSRLLARAATPVAALAGALALAAPAFAHVEVESATPQALAVGAVVAFDAEGESKTAGISQVRVALPAGIAPGDVTLADGPKGWQLSAVDGGYQVAGPALAPGRSAAYKIKVRQLPDAPQLVFKSLVTYTDGRVDRWIELPQGGAEPAHPAPVLKLTAAAPGAKPLPATGTSAPPSTTASASAAPSTGAPAQAAPSDTAAPSASPAASAGGSSGSGAATVAVVGVLVVAVAGVLLWRRRAARG
ncbi:DUF1775 domain-containing protein [Kitasatospora sp. NPDC059571]|uniref:DUF1775 domain-containing protein n=1 Tax=Kitasatospora sp. NPDC059571 TaxID=3346871 RepID=UPI003687200E